MVGFDEGRPEQHRAAWWAAYLGGGVWEAHVPKPHDRPISAWEPTWTELGGARAFMETLPFWEMEPRNDLVKSGKAICLAKPGQAYGYTYRSVGVLPSNWPMERSMRSFGGIPPAVKMEDCTTKRR
jgi:hypothetical protein